MNYEEKYKEMKKRVLAIGQGYVKEVDYSSPRSIAEYIDPELKESEDERIKQEVIKLVHFFYGSSLACEHLVSEDNMIAWLEKQGKTSSWIKNRTKSDFEIPKNI